MHFYLKSHHDFFFHCRYRVGLRPMLLQRASPPGIEPGPLSDYFSHSCHLLQGNSRAGKISPQACRQPALPFRLPCPNLLERNNSLHVPLQSWWSRQCFTVLVQFHFIFFTHGSKLLRLCHVELHSIAHKVFLLTAVFCAFLFPYASYTWPAFEIFYHTCHAQRAGHLQYRHMRTY